MFTEVWFKDDVVASGVTGKSGLCVMIFFKSEACLQTAGGVTDFPDMMTTLTANSWDDAAPF